MQVGHHPGESERHRLAAPAFWPPLAFLPQTTAKSSPEAQKASYWKPRPQHAIEDCGSTTTIFQNPNHRHYWSESPKHQQRVGTATAGGLKTPFRENESSEVDLTRPVHYLRFLMLPQLC